MKKISSIKKHTEAPGALTKPLPAAWNNNIRTIIHDLITKRMKLQTITLEPPASENPPLRTQLTYKDGNEIMTAILNMILEKPLAADAILFLRTAGQIIMKNNDSKNQTHENVLASPSLSWKPLKSKQLKQPSIISWIEGFWGFGV